MEREHAGGMERRRNVIMEKKWSDERGETLVEVMASILIMTLAVLLLFSAVMTSIRINKSAQDLDKKFYVALNAAEEQKQGTEVTDNTIVPAGSKVKVGQGTDLTEIAVNFYGGEGALSYSYPSPAGP